MKKYNFPIFLLVILSSCFIIKEAPPGDSTYTTLINNSGYNIEIQKFYNGNLQHFWFVDNNSNFELNAESGDPGGPTGPSIRPLSGADSIWIIYFEKASIMHTTDVNSPVSKSLMLESSYEGGKVRDGLYEFTYTFTPEDYEEALEFGD